MSKPRTPEEHAKYQRYREITMAAVSARNEAWAAEVKPKRRVVRQRTPEGHIRTVFRPVFSEAEQLERIGTLIDDAFYE